MFYLTILLSYIHKTLLDVSREIRPLLCCFGRIVTLWIIILSIHWENGLKNKQSPNSWLLNWIFTEIGRFQSANVLKTDLERRNIQIGLPWGQTIMILTSFVCLLENSTYITTLPFHPLFFWSEFQCFQNFRLQLSHESLKCNFTLPDILLGRLRENRVFGIFTFVVFIIINVFDNNHFVWQVHINTLL